MMTRARFNDLNEDVKYELRHVYDGPYLATNPKLNDIMMFISKQARIAAQEGWQPAEDSLRALLGRLFKNGHEIIKKERAGWY